MLRSSFASFNTARLAIQANQSALGIVGQNMANVKTPGYTRQRLDQVSLNLRGISSSYEAIPDAHIGYGVMVTGVSQIRDPFLDSRYRLEMSNLGTYDKKVELLDKIGVVFDETDKSGLDLQLQDFADQLRAMAKSPSNSNDSMVRSSAQTLTSILRNYSKQLDDVKNYAISSAEQDITDVNNILTEIQQLNISIKNSQVHGNPALELQDSRNLLIDELATYAQIKVNHTTDVTMTGAAVDVLKIDFIDENGNTINLIDDTKKPGQLSLRKANADDPDDLYSINIADSQGINYAGVTSGKGTIKSSLSMLNEKGEFDTPASAERGVGYYTTILDKLASQLANSFNQMNTLPGVTDMGGNLFTASDGSGVITAANISISDGWLNGSVNLVASRAEGAPSDDTSNISNMVNLLDKSQQFVNPNGATFHGTYQEYFSNMVNIQAVDQKSTTTILESYLSVAKEISNSKDSVSGVNQDEEAMDMMQYNSSLTAASRLMTTLDEALNTIISSMGIVGR